MFINFQIYEKRYWKINDFSQSSNKDMVNKVQRPRQKKRVANEQNIESVRLDT